MTVGHLVTCSLIADLSAASLSGTTHPEAGSGPGQPAANQEAAGAAASQVLEQMESLRSEMRMLLKVRRG